MTPTDRWRPRRRLDPPGSPRCRHVGRRPAPAQAQLIPPRDDTIDVAAVAAGDRAAQLPHRREHRRPGAQAARVPAGAHLPAPPATSSTRRGSRTARPTSSTTSGGRSCPRRWACSAATRRAWPFRSRSTWPATRSTTRARPPTAASPRAASATSASRARRCWRRWARTTNTRWRCPPGCRCPPARPRAARTSATRTSPAASRRSAPPTSASCAPPPTWASCCARPRTTSRPRWGTSCFTAPPPPIRSNGAST